MQTEEDAVKNDFSAMNLSYTDPVLIYGPAIFNFFKLNIRLVGTFFFLAILALLQMIVFRSFNGVEGDALSHITANWSFAGFGFPRSLCSKAYLDWENQDSITLMFECNGHTQVTSVFSSGIVSYANSTDYPGLTEVFG